MAGTDRPFTTTSPAAGGVTARLTTASATLPPPPGRGATEVTVPTPSPSITTGEPGSGATSPASSTPRRCRGTLPPRLSMRATSSWPVKHPLVKLTDASMTRWPTSAGMVASVSSAPMAGTPQRMRSDSYAAPSTAATVAGARTWGPSRSTASTPGHPASARTSAVASSAAASAPGPRSATHRQSSGSTSALVRSRKRRRRATTASP